MNFKKALVELKAGAKMKRPLWGDYWCWDSDKETIVMYTKDGLTMDIRETQNVEYTLGNILADDWLHADETNTPVLDGTDTFDFGYALKYLKRGRRVSRRGWNGKEQYIELASGISYQTPDGSIMNCEHEAIGSNAIAFVGTSGVQMGWLASQADMLAEDWMFAE